MNRSRLLRRKALQTADSKPEAGLEPTRESGQESASCRDFTASVDIGSMRISVVADSYQPGKRVLVSDLTIDKGFTRIVSEPLSMALPKLEFILRAAQEAAR